MGVNLCHRMNGSDDQNDLMTDANLAANLCHRMNDLLGDQNSDVMTDVNLCHHMNGSDDLNLVASRVNRNCVRRDLMMVLKKDVNLCLRMNDLLGGHLMDVNHVNRSCVRRDLTMDANLVVMNHHVKSMVFPNMNCDRMSHDHLRCDHQMMRHHDTNRMDGKNLDGKMKIHHVNHRMKVYRMRLNRASHLMMVCRMKI